MPKEWNFGLAESAFVQLKPKIFGMQTPKCMFQILIVLCLRFAIDQNIVHIGHNARAVLECIVDCALKSHARVLQAQGEFHILMWTQWHHC